jgi:hypothetical protein
MRTVGSVRCNSLRRTEQTINHLEAIRRIENTNTRRINILRVQLSKLAANGGSLRQYIANSEAFLSVLATGPTAVSRLSFRINLVICFGHYLGIIRIKHTGNEIVCCLFLKVYHPPAYLD